MRTADSIEENKARNGKVLPENSAHISTKRRRDNGGGERLKAWRFQLGKSGNPGGRQKNNLAKEIAQAVFENNPSAIYRAFTKAIMKGNAYTFKELAERTYGRLPEPKEITHKYQNVADGDLQQRIDAILKELGLVKQIDNQPAVEVKGEEKGTA